MTLAWISAVLALLVLAMTWINLVTWPRPGAGGHAQVEACLPARNEAHQIAPCVAALLAEPLQAIHLWDDGSTDGTADVARQAAGGDPRLQVATGGTLPRGWVGKVHACHQLSLRSQAEWLLFVDADTTLRAGAVAKLVGLQQRYQADLVTLLPHQVLGSAAEQALVPWLHVTYLSWFPLALVHLSKNIRFLAANGQVVLIRRAALEAAGGFAAIRAEVVDDMALAARFKRLGYRVVFADGQELASTRMYTSLGQIWSGFSKNLYEGVGGPLGLVASAGLYGLTFLVPWLALGAGLIGSPELVLPGLVGVGALLGQRLLLAWRFGHWRGGAWLAPLSVPLVMALALNSWRWARADAILWSGRTYAGRRRRWEGPPA